MGGAGQRILGLGDLGANGAGISVGKALLYTVAGGLHPNSVLPVVLDVGCDDEAFREGDGYVGRREARLTGPQYDAFVDDFFTACQVRATAVSQALWAALQGRPDARVSQADVATAGAPLQRRGLWTAWCSNMALVGLRGVRGRFRSGNVPAEVMHAITQGASTPASQR